MAEAKTVNAKPQVTLDDIKFNEANKTTAILACIPLVGFVLMLVEKNDQFVRYMGAEYTLVGVACFVLNLVLGFIPVIGWLLGCLITLALLGVVIYGFVQVSKGVRFDIPVVSGFALKVINAI